MFNLLKVEPKTHSYELNAITSKHGQEPWPNGASEDARKLMNLKLFDKEKDYSTLVEWYEQNGQQAPEMDVLSPIGLKSDHFMGFIYLAGNMSFLEHFVKNPESSREDVWSSCAEIAHELMKTAKNQDCKYVMVITGYKNIKEMALAMGMNIGGTNMTTLGGRL